MKIQKPLALRVTRHLRTAVGYSCSIGAGFAVISMGALFIGAALIGVTGAWFALYKLEEYFEAQHGAAIESRRESREIAN